MPDVNYERLNRNTQTLFGVDANQGLRYATGINADANGVSQRLYRNDLNGALGNTDNIYEVLEEANWLGTKNTPFVPANLTQRNFTADTGQINTPTVDSNGYLSYTASGTTVVYSSSLRKIWTVNGSSASDIEAMTVLDPQNQGVDTGGGNSIFMQGGLCVRYQTGATHTGIMINNNVAFGTLQINIGVWKSNTDGTGFSNRQGAFPNFSNPPFPYGLKFRLVGSVVQAWVFSPNEGIANGTTNPDRYQQIDLNVAGQAGTAPEIAAIPTPVGAGQYGFITAHMGSDARCIYKFRRTSFRPID